MEEVSARWNKHEMNIYRSVRKTSMIGSLLNISGCISVINLISWELLMASYLPVDCQVTERREGSRKV